MLTLDTWCCWELTSNEAETYDKLLRHTVYPLSTWCCPSSQCTEGGKAAL
jgi:hypothetical protein